MAKYLSLKFIALFSLLIISSFSTETIQNSFAEEITDPPKYIHLSWQHDPTTTIIISWKTVNETESIVQYGETDITEAETSGAPGSWHHVELTNLKPGTTYYYRVGNGKEWSPIYTFKTVPEGSHLRFIIWGDTRHNRVERKTVAEAIGKLSYDFMLFTGDAVDDGRVSSLWHRLFADIESAIIKAPFMPILGNHEENGSVYYTIFALPGKEEYWSLDFPMLHVNALHSCVARYGGTFDEQVAWLENDLTKVSDEVWKLALLHRPPYSSSSRFYEGRTADLITTFVPIFERHNIAMVASGHDHFYERLLINNITYLVTGGGGAPLYNPSKPINGSIYREKTLHFVLIDLYENQLDMRAYRPDYTLMDHYTINKFEGSDLAILTLPMTIEQQWNESRIYEITIINNGNKPTTKETTAIVSVSDGTNWTLTIPPLSPKEKVTFELNWTSPQIGLYKWSIKIDPENQIKEGLELNNELEFYVNATGYIPPTKKSAWFESNLILSSMALISTLFVLVLLKKRKSHSYGSL